MVIPYILNSIENAELCTVRDVCVSARTGSGKTLSFVLPILQRILSNLSNSPPPAQKKLVALCVLPSRDLARQVYEVFSSVVNYSSGCGVRVGLAAAGAGHGGEEEIVMTKDGKVEDKNPPVKEEPKAAEEAKADEPAAAPAPAPAADEKKEEAPEEKKEEAPAES